MACTEWDYLFEAFQNEQFRDAIFCGFQDNIGGPTFALLVMGVGIGGYVYTKTESMTMVFVLVLVLGGVILPQIASVGIAFAVLVLLAILGLGPIILLRRTGRL